jgi:hypothetical protein
MIRLGLLTSWNTQCGIAEYSRFLRDALQRTGEVAVTVFGTRNFGERAVIEYTEGEYPCFDAQVWHPEHVYELDVDAILEHELDVLHVQYSNLFYNRRRLVDLLRRFPGVVALTYHDKIVNRVTFPYQLADLLYAHREDVGVGPRRLIPQGIDVHRPVIKSFGLGKSRNDVIADICERNGWLFARSFGEDRWLTAEELYHWLRDCDAIVLWYDEDRTSGGSAALPFAISTRRPIFVNDVEWFRDVPDRTATVQKVSSVEELEECMRALLVDEYANERSWDRVAQTLLADYRKALEERGQSARRVPLRARGYALLDDKPLIAIKRRLEKRGARA